jgi:PIN domain nuclease of toxin-antitoxin system
MLEDPAQIPLFSVASLWELVIKAGLNRAGFDNHVTAVADLPLLHRDPFDRLLLAQAKAEAMLLMTADQQLAGYPGPIRWMASL